MNIMQNKFKRVITLVMIIAFISGICPQVTAFAATKKELTTVNTNNGTSIDKNEINKETKDNSIDKSNNREENKDLKKNTTGKGDSDKTKNSDKKTINASDDKLDDESNKVIDELLDDEDEVKPKTGWQVINGKRFYFTEEGMLKKKGWVELDEYIYKGTKSNPQTIEAVLKDVNLNNKFKDNNKENKKILDEEKNNINSDNNEDIDVLDDENEEEIKNEEDKDSKIEDKKDKEIKDNDKLKEHKKSTSTSNNVTIIIDPSQDPNYELHKNKYYFDDDYSAVVGWQEIGGKWYNFNDLGIMRTGWSLINYNWFFLDDDGEMKTGWFKDGTNKFYLNESGAMIFGKNYIDDKWYYFHSSGVLATGVYLRDGKWYYSNKDGEMISNKWIDLNDKKYYVKANSELAVGNIIIDGKMQHFDNDGVYQGTGIMEEHLYIKYLNVGDGDCIYIKLPNGETALIDTGDNNKSSQNTLIDFLEDQNLKEDAEGKGIIDYVVITHPHSDHIGGLYEVLKNFKVNKIYMPNRTRMEDYSDLKEEGEFASTIKDMKKDYHVYQKTLNLIKELDIPFLDAVQYKAIDEEGILKFVQPDKSYLSTFDSRIPAKYWILNDQSAVVYLNYGDLGALFTGDIEWPAEKDYSKLDLLLNKKVDVLKVPHHGLNTSSTLDFLNYVGADIGVISRASGSVNKNNAYNNLTNGKVTIFETSEKDGVSLYATKQNWNVQY
ncbi:MBL fold metallo-hydrolase [Clostridium sp. YB-6]|uniref:MBL fold metallo-hydrolase n=2 Tax=Clostridium weizhouense TaxID=2859781 RepID=A0ABS7ANP2_9CLOT|nr:MBL fold metallo-hydrolase [Clostridium weizhouense]